MDVKARARDAARLRESLTAGRWDDFLASARRYRVRYVTFPVSQRSALRRRPIPILRRVFSSRKELGVDVYELRRMSRGP